MKTSLSIALASSLLALTVIAAVTTNYTPGTGAGPPPQNVGGSTSGSSGGSATDAAVISWTNQFGWGFAASNTVYQSNAINGSWAKSVGDYWMHSNHITGKYTSGTNGIVSTSDGFSTPGIYGFLANGLGDTQTRTTTTLFYYISGTSGLGANAGYYFGTGPYITGLWCPSVGNITVQTNLQALGTVIANGFHHPQVSAVPTAAEIGGVVGSVTNSLTRNVGGKTMLYWGDGTTLYSKQLAP